MFGPNYVVTTAQELEFKLVPAQLSSDNLQGVRNRHGRQKKSPQTKLEDQLPVTRGDRQVLRPVRV